ncbi:hypothetical protein GX48_01694 [Paracoccidioides brasiliensis]|nr:hypothetical protein GX48_01694 [Paracoccidioides brasiliensis]
MRGQALCDNAYGREFHGFGGGGGGDDDDDDDGADTTESICTAKPGQPGQTQVTERALKACLHVHHALQKRREQW